MLRAMGWMTTTWAGSTLALRPAAARPGAVRRPGALLAILCLLALPARAAEFTVRTASSPAELAVERIEPGTAVVFDHRAGEDGRGLIPFEEWARDNPVQKQLLALHPGYQEPMVPKSVDGQARTVREKLGLYVATGRFVVDKPPSKLDLARYASLDFLARMDPAIRHRLISPEEAVPAKDPEAPYNRRPDRRWCEAPKPVLCIASTYALEGKLPMGIRLANKLDEGAKKIAESIDFQSELRVIPPAEIDPALYARLTGLDAPVAGALEQSIFHVNQIMRFGKLLAVLQPHPRDPGKTVVTLFMTLAVKADVLDRKSEFGAVPVLRNLVPAQVLMGKSSFNAGESISAGLPAYARNRVKAVAGILSAD
jgi:hypothetical protein